MIIKEKKIASTKALSKIECQLRYLMQNMSSYIFYSLQTVSYTISIILKKEALLSVTMAKYLRHKEYEDVISSF